MVGRRINKPLGQRPQRYAGAADNQLAHQTVKDSAFGSQSSSKLDQLLLVPLVLCLVIADINIIVRIPRMAQHLRTHLFYESLWREGRLDPGKSSVFLSRQRFIAPTPN